jgi:hypothetical protein
MKHRRAQRKTIKRGSFKTSVLKGQPLKMGVSQGFRLRNARASAKLTEFCKRLKIK